MSAINDNRVLFFPLRTSLAFLIVSELLLFIGPIVFDLWKPVLLVFYLLLVNLAFYWGYNTGVKRFKPSRSHLSLDAIHVIIIAGLVLNIIRLNMMWRSHGITVSLSNLIAALINPADAYFAESLEKSDTSSIFAFLSPITWACLPLGIYKWKHLSRFYKSLVIIIIVVEALAWLGIGTRKGLFDIIIFIVFFIIVNKKSIITNHNERRKFLFCIVLIVVLFAFYFVFSNLSRSNLSINQINEFNLKYTIRDFYSDHCPFWLLVSLSSITSYLCQGYYALSLGLSFGIIPPTFLGMSWFTMVIANKFGYDPMPGTYMTLLEPLGIDPRINWHTMYLWLANDFTFIGVPIVVFIIGYFFAKTWCDCVHGENDFAIPIFSLFLIMVFYFYANNQVLSFSLIAFVFWLIVYGLSRRYNINI